ncbi:S-adenosyl-L-methionine-dependent methyltransferase [Xylariales sp. PMI_506]|nr:S-adenosyl-L-methionine-dependent methyltransferase [Xylariales sp. PMI_506]
MTSEAKKRTYRPLAPAPPPPPPHHGSHVPNDSVPYQNQATPQLNSEAFLNDYHSPTADPNTQPSLVARYIETEPDLHQRTGTSIQEADSIVDGNGRTYQGYREGKYFLPNDPPEQDRLDFQYTGLSKLLGGRLFHAPIESPTKVLDVATGTGIWAIQFAEQHPACTVIGTDLSLIQPSVAPPNCSFVREDMEEPWVHQEASFDYVHFRLVCTCLSQPETVLASTYEALRPGGWVEFQDVDSQLRGAEGTNVEKAWGLAIQGAAALGRNILIPREYNRLLRQAGFVDIQEFHLPWPINDWSTHPNLKIAGAYNARAMLDNARGVLWKALEALGYSATEIEQMVLEAKLDFLNRNIHGYWSFIVIYARKPFDWEIKASAS